MTVHQMIWTSPALPDRATPKLSYMKHAMLKKIMSSLISMSVHLWFLPKYFNRHSWLSKCCSTQVNHIQKIMEYLDFSHCLKWSKCTQNLDDVVSSQSPAQSNNVSYSIMWRYCQVGTFASALFSNRRAVCLNFWLITGGQLVQSNTIKQGKILLFVVADASFLCH